MLIEEEAILYVMPGLYDPCDHHGQTAELLLHSANNTMTRMCIKSGYASDWLILPSRSGTETGGKGTKR